MHFALGLLFVLIGLAIATRRTRPLWWITLVSVLAALGIAWSIMSLTGLTFYIGFTAISWIGWSFLALSAMTMLSAFFVLERRGPNGEEQPAIIGENFLDGDTDDTDDPRSPQS